MSDPGRALGQAFATCVPSGPPPERKRAAELEVEWAPSPRQPGDAGIEWAQNDEDDGALPEKLK
jgi:hypothetical protein